MMIFEKRIERLRQALKSQGVDAIYVSNLTNVRYLSGFTGSAAVLLVLPEEVHFFSDTRYELQAPQEVKAATVHMTGSDGYLRTIASLNLLSKDLKVAFEANHVSVNLFQSMNTVFDQVTWFKTTGMVEVLAATKDSTEIEHLRKATEITDQAFTEILKEVRPGISEKAIAAKISYLFKMLGADKDSYDPIVASGPNSALPHATPSTRQLANGDFLLLDMGAVYAGYHADMTRTVVLGEASDKQREIYDLVLKSQQTGIQTARAGISGAELDQACRTVIDQAGYGPQFCHSTGHGIGLEVHTHPTVSRMNSKPLEENFVVTIEPGVYLPDWGGVRIEDDCLILKEACEPLNKSPKELLVIEG